VDERRAIERLKQGDIGGLATLVRQYQSGAIRTAYLITHDLALAEDVVQDVFLQVYRSIHSFDTSRPLEPWLKRSVVNAAVKACRAREGEFSLENDPAAGAGASGITFEDLLPDPAPGPDARLEAAEIAAAVEEALQRLPPEQRVAIVLRYYLDAGDDEIAAQLDCAPGTVRWRLHAARKQLGVLLRRWVVSVVG
jgi:RNA polymerase sigma-70 factor (ECF subfamily)